MIDSLNTKKASEEIKLILNENCSLNPNLTCNNPNSDNKEKLEPEMFFNSDDKNQKIIMNSYFELRELKTKLLEHLENYAIENDITREKSGEDFYDLNFEGLKEFSKLGVSTDEDKENLFDFGEYLITKFYPKFHEESDKEFIITVFHLKVRRIFRR
jgi:hypothetical protein